MIRNNGLKFYHVILIGFVLIGLLIGIATIGSSVQYSEGYREGTLQKLSYRGFFWKTWDGEVALWGFGGKHGEKLGQNQISNVWAFSLKDPKAEQTKEFVSQINDNSMNSTKVRLYYNEYLTALPWQGSSSYFVNKVVVYKNDGTQVVLEPGKQPVQQTAKE